MISIQIGNYSREYNSTRDIEESWILHQIIEQRKAGINVSVRIRIHQSPLNIALATPNATSGGGGGGQANAAELTAFNLWNECGLNSNNFDAGWVIEFLKRVAKLIR
jgi:hypothetical protein